jgi:hypothetical protein
MMSAYKSMITGYKQAGGKFYISQQFSSNHMLYTSTFLFSTNVILSFARLFLKGDE